MTADNGVICPFKDKCLNFPLSCETCEHNKGKRSYYKPSKPQPSEYWTPYPRWIDEPPRYPIIWCRWMI